MVLLLDCFQSVSCQAEHRERTEQASLRPLVCHLCRAGHCVLSHTHPFLQPGSHVSEGRPGHAPGHWLRTPALGRGGGEGCQSQGAASWGLPWGLGTSCSSPLWVVVRMLQSGSPHPTWGRRHPPAARRWGRATAPRVGGSGSHSGTRVTGQLCPGVGHSACAPRAMALHLWGVRGGQSSGCC